MIKSTEKVREELSRDKIGHPEFFLVPSRRKKVLKNPENGI
jgi:hypothetical protein